MTAEIALLNRRALAFAADSAITITRGTNEKIYNSAEKIFELSHAVPLGLMLYNAMEFVGVPLDVLARSFRSEHDTRFKNAKEACLAFANFLQEFPHSPQDESQHLENVLEDELNVIMEKQSIEAKTLFVSIMEDESSKKFSKNEGLPLDFRELQKHAYTIVIEERLKAYSDDKLDDYLSDKTIDDFKSAYQDAIKRVISRTAREIKDDVTIIEKVIELAFAMVRSAIFSDHLTGVVVGGFGAATLFPELHAVELDGMYFCQVKMKTANDVKIDSRRKRAEIVPFAQSEMVERFLFGIDAEMESAVLKFIKKSSGKAIKTLHEKTGIDFDDIGLGADAYTVDVERLFERLKKKSRDETFDMVDFMPKQELAYTAEAFVTLTSIKRKVSAQRETVGGPIDVAIITRNEGFVWIKRKHYFNQELNPGYYVRTFGQNHGGENDSAKTERRRGAHQKS